MKNLGIIDMQSDGKMITIDNFLNDAWIIWIHLKIFNSRSLSKITYKSI